MNAYRVRNKFHEGGTRFTVRKKAWILLAGFLLVHLALPPEAWVRGPDYSEKYTEEIMYHAKNNYVPSSLVRAIIITESGFNPKAVSDKGAKGLMQLMPGVCERYGVDNPFDASQNIRAGTAYLREMLDQFSHLTLALAAYNAGPEAVKNHNGVPPFTETRNFIMQVYRHYNSYRKMINRHAPVLKLTWPTLEEAAR